MSLECPVYYEVKLALLMHGGCYLYKNPRPTQAHIIFTPNYNESTCIGNTCHVFRIEEKRCGFALFITRICTLCDEGSIEVIPQHQKEILRV